jgi:hypothetical protein
MCNTIKAYKKVIDFTHTRGHIMGYNKNYHCTSSFAQGNSSKSNKMAAAFSM